MGSLEPPHMRPPGPLEFANFLLCVFSHTPVWDGRPPVGWLCFVYVGVGVDGESVLTDNPHGYAQWEPCEHLFIPCHLLSNLVSQSLCFPHLQNGLQGGT